MAMETDRQLLNSIRKQNDAPRHSVDTTPLVGVIKMAMETDRQLLNSIRKQNDAPRHSVDTTPLVEMRQPVQVGERAPDCCPKVTKKDRFCMVKLVILAAVLVVALFVPFYMHPDCNLGLFGCWKCVVVRSPCYVPPVPGNVSWVVG
eukprot:TRINITY_DN3228_c0_g1_i1.p2 TRINITY_DN3228_c0_g1~~TRINITY_DN3228_c0_g1_i1.p2  ORF type:complete len:158 (+),score=11.70 TRINITY_DN3228_c0_g1_i1:35-475(+)